MRLYGSVNASIILLDCVCFKLAILNVAIGLSTEVIDTGSSKISHMCVFVCGGVSDIISVPL